MSHDDSRGSLDALTSEFREVLVNLEREGQEYRQILNDLKQAKTLSERPTHSKETLPTRIVPSSSNKNTKSTYSQTSTANIASTSTATSSSITRSHIKSLYNTIRNQLDRRNRTMTAAISRGALIVLEGLDRVGKSTLAKELVEHLERKKLNVSLLRFPDRSTPIGKLIDEFLNSNKRVDNHAMHLLFSANRWELAKKIRNTINQGTTVVVDRYSYSGIAYSCAKKDMSLKWSIEMERGLPRPDLVIFLELSRELQFTRPGFGVERFENIEMQDLVRHQYNRVMEISNETWLRVQADKKTSSQILDEVIVQVRRCLENCTRTKLGDLDFLDI